MLKIGNIQLNTLKAITKEEQAQGLSGRESLSEDTCMVFPFVNFPTQHFFNTTMMLFPIDIICVKNNKIIHIEKNVAKGNMLIKLPGSNFVIEMNAGIADKNGWIAGMPVYGLDKL